MRISGGDAKGVKLRVPPGARPPGERVRQAVFSSIAASLPDARVLDLYCGSGAYGLEALSRGASDAIFVDNDPYAVTVCRANAKAAGVESFSRVHKADAANYLRRRAPKEGPFDLVFADPPYDRTPMKPVLDALAAVVQFGALVLLEARSRQGDVTAPEGFVVEDDRRYGDTRVLMFRRGGSGE